MEQQNMFKLRQHTKKCLAKNPDKAEKERKENNLVNGSKDQIFVWTVKKYLQYKSDQLVKKEKAVKTTENSIKKTSPKKALKRKLENYEQGDEEEFCDKVKAPKTEDLDKFDDSLMKEVKQEAVKNGNDTDNGIEPNELLRVKCEAESDNDDGYQDEMDNFDFGDGDDDGDSSYEPDEADEHFKTDIKEEKESSDNEESNLTEDSKEGILGNMLLRHLLQQPITTTLQIQKSLDDADAKPKYKPKPKKIHTCEECGLELSNIKEMRKHKNQVHKAEIKKQYGGARKTGPVMCPHCGKMIASAKHLREHIKRMHEEYLNKPEGEGHEVFNGVNDSSVCTTCGKEFENARLLRLHVKQTHDRHKHIQVCPYCAKEIFNLKKHIRDYHPHPEDEDKEILCKECDTIVIARDWKQHKSKIHGREICPFCGILATKEHIEYVHKVQPVPCDICHAVLKNKRALRNHKMKVHPPTEILSCTDCHQVFENKIKLYAHKYAVHNYEESKCEWCGGTYKNRKLLQAHKRVMHKDLYVGRDQRVQ